MNRVRGQVLSWLMVGACGAVAASACTHDDTTIFVRDVLAPQPVAIGQSCMFTSDPTQPFIESGVLDISFRHDYSATFLVGNQMVPEGNPSTPSTETSFIDIQGAVVRITDSDGNQLTSFTALAGVTIPPAIGTTPTYAPISVTILDQPTVETPSFFDGIFENRDVKRLITYTRFFGKTLGGLSVESNEFEFPVEVCRACLIGFSSADNDPLLPSPNCNGTGASSSTLPVPCVLGQDTTVDCSECAGVADCSPNGPLTTTDAGVAAEAGGD